MDLWGPGWRCGMEQGEQPSWWLGHLYKATTEGTLLETWCGTVEHGPQRRSCWGDCPAGAVPGHQRLSPPVDTKVWHRDQFGNERGVGRPRVQRMDATSTMPSSGTLVPAPAAGFKLFKSRCCPLPPVSEQKVTIPASGMEKTLGDGRGSPAAAWSEEGRLKPGLLSPPPPRVTQILQRI